MLDEARTKGHTEIIAFFESIATIATPKQSTPTSGERATCCAPSDKRECANCSAPQSHTGVALLTCSRCKLVYYCGTACQAQHWKEGGHKKHCIALSDRSVKAAIAPKSRTFTNVDKCGICLEPLSSEGIKPLSCGHVFHSECIESMKSSGVAHVCPTCRSGF